MPASTPLGLAEAKQELRRRARAARAERGEDRRREVDRARTRLLWEAMPASAAVALYASLPPEPDTRELLALLLGRQRVLLPVLSPMGPGRPRHDPCWAWCASMDDLRPGLWGIPEPAGEVLDAGALAAVDLVLAPGLAAARDGSRLGTGGGWYDRALPHRRVGTPVWVLLDEDEVFDTVPHGPRDVQVDAVATGSGVLGLGHGHPDGAPRRTG